MTPCGVPGRIRSPVAGLDLAVAGVRGGRMTLIADRIRQRLARGDAVDLRGHGKAGGGLVLAIQAFGEALSANPELDVQDWPLFSSARKGANVCAYLRVA